MADKMQNTEVDAKNKPTSSSGEAPPITMIIEKEVIPKHQLPLKDLQDKYTIKDIDEGRVPQTVINRLAQEAYEADVMQQAEGDKILLKEREDWIARPYNEPDWKQAHNAESRQQILAEQWNEIETMKAQGYRTDDLEKDFYNSLDFVDHIKAAFTYNISQYEKGDFGPLIKFMEVVSQGKLIPSLVAAYKQAEVTNEHGDIFDKAKAMFNFFFENKHQSSYDPKQLEFVQDLARLEQKNDPIKAFGGEVLTDPLTFAPIPLAKAGATLKQTFWEGAKVMAPYMAALDYAKHSGDEDYSYKQTLLAGAGGAVIGGTAHVAMPYIAKGFHAVGHKTGDMTGWLKDKIVASDLYGKTFGRKGTTDILDDEIKTTLDILNAVKDDANKTLEHPSAATTGKMFTQPTSHTAHEMHMDAMNEVVMTDPKLSPLKALIDKLPKTMRDNAALVYERLFAESIERLKAKVQTFSTLDIEDILANGTQEEIQALKRLSINELYHLVSKEAEGDVYRPTQTFIKDLLKARASVTKRALEKAEMASAEEAVRPLEAKVADEAEANSILSTVVKMFNIISDKLGSKSLVSIDDLALSRIMNHIGHTYEEIKSGAAGSLTPESIVSRVLQETYDKAVAAYGSIYRHFSIDFEKGLFKFEGKYITPNEFNGLIEKYGSDFIDFNPMSKDHKLAIFVNSLIEHVKENPGANLDKLIESFAKALSKTEDSVIYFGSTTLASRGGAAVIGGAIGLSTDINGDGKKDGTDVLIGALGGYFLTRISSGLWAIGKNIYNKTQLKITPEARNAYRHAQKETVDRLLQLKKEVQEQIKKTTFDSSRAALVRQLENINTHLSNINKLKGLDQFLAAQTDQRIQAYFESKVAPLVQVNQDTVAEIVEALNKNDFAKASSLIDFNLTRIDSEEEVVALLETTSRIAKDLINKTKRGTVSFNEIQETAYAYGMSIEKANALFSDTNMLAERMLAARMLLLRVTKEAIDVGNKAINGTMTDVDRLEFHRLLNVQAAIQAQVKGSQTEIARALAAMRITSRGNHGAPAETLQKILQQLDANGQLDDAIRKYMASPGDIQSAMAEALTQPKGLLVLTEIFINSILSGLKTHLTNVTANTLLAIDGLAENVVTSRSLGEAKATIFGFSRGVIEAFGYGWRALKSGKSSLDVLDKTEIIKAIDVDYLWPSLENKVMRSAINGTGAVVNIPGRLLNAEDDFFKSMAYRMKIYKLAYRKAANENPGGKVTAERVDELVKDVQVWLEARNMNNPAQDDFINMLQNMDKEYQAGLEEMFQGAMEEAKYRTFTNELGPRGRSIQNAIAANPEARFIIPFVRTPTNILKFYAARLPIINLLFENITRTEYKSTVTTASSFEKMLTPGSRMTEEEVDKIKVYMYRSLIGGALLYAGFEGAKSGDLTGGIPSKNMTMQEAGYVPYSWKNVLSYQRGDPYGMFFSNATDLYSLLSVEDKPLTANDEVYGAILAATTNNFLDKAYVNGLQDFIEVLNSEEPGRYEKWVNKMAASFIPSALSSYTYSEDPVQREATTMIETLQAKIPGQSKLLPPKYDYRGREKLRVGDPIMPFKVHTREQDKLDKEIVRLKINFEPLNKSIDGYELSSKEKALYSKIAGETFNKIALPLVNSPGWETQYSDNQKGFEGSKVLVLKKIMMAAREQAKLQLLGSNKQILDSYVNRKVIQGKAYTGEQITKEDLAKLGI